MLHVTELCSLTPQPLPHLTHKSAMGKLKYHMTLMSHILKSASGFYVYPFSPSWDSELQQLLNEGILIATSKYNAIFHHNDNVVEVWIANRWYGYGWLNRVNGRETDAPCTRPRFRTMYRLHQMVQAFQAKET